MLFASMYACICCISVLSICKDNLFKSIKRTNTDRQSCLSDWKNYIDLLTSAVFQNSLKVTLIYVVIVVFGSMLLGLVTAVLCNKGISGNPCIFNCLCTANGNRISSLAAMILRSC